MYLDGRNWCISSKERLSRYIDEDQKDLKDSLGVNLVYLPNNLNIEEYIGFEKN